MTKFKAYTGKILDVNLSCGTTSNYNLSDLDREKFLGSRFISDKILWDQLQPGVDALSADNIIVIMTAPLTGSGAPSSSRYDISAKSPLTGAIGHSNSGGNFGIHLKRAGWDGIIIRGKAASPVYLEIENENIKIKPADHLWGRDTQAAQAALGKGGTLAIGPAGENLVKFASVLSQERSHGRTGMGAVLGSKKLKGVVARGKHKFQFHDRTGFKQLTKEWIKLLQKHPATGEFLPKYGTAGFLKSLSAQNALPTRNFSSGTYEDAWMISGERLADQFMIKNSGCVTCPVRCSRVVEIDGEEVKGPEYEILCMMGSNLKINDLEALIRFNYQLDLLGMDTISIGNVLGFAMEMNARGLWKNGINFGESKGISTLLEKIALRQGIGDDLAEGVRFLSNKYGGTDFAAHVKGLELSAYEPRAAVGHALGYAVAPRGGCHLDGGYCVYLEVLGPLTLAPLHFRSKPGWVIIEQNLLGAVSAGGNCLFSAWTSLPSYAFKLLEHQWLSKLISLCLTYSWSLADLSLKLPRAWFNFHLPDLPHTRAIETAAGMKMPFGKFIEIGDRGYTLEKMFNLREGIGRQEDKLPGRFINTPSGVPLAKMLPKYYQLKGWDQKGVPRPNVLKKLGLGFTLSNLDLKEK